MKALELGGNGFIGSHIVDGLISAVHQVRVFDRGAWMCSFEPGRIQEISS